MIDRVIDSGENAMNIKESSAPPQTEFSIFFSYAQEDAAVALAITKRLEELGVRTWIDRGKIRAGELVIERISNAIISSDFFVALVSLNSVNSIWCQRELSIAVDKDLQRGLVRVLPLRLDNVEMPPLLQGISYLEVDSRNPVAVVDQLVSHARGHLEKHERIGKISEISDFKKTASGLSFDAVGEVRQSPVRLCLKLSTLTALIEQRATSGEIRQAVEHLFGTPWTEGCKECSRYLAALFLREANHSDLEVASAISLREGSLLESPGTLFGLFNCVDSHGYKAAEPDTLAKWERWAENRREARGAIDRRFVPPVILSSYALRYQPDAPGLLSYARLATVMADAAADPWIQAMAYSWLSRVRGIRGELREASREMAVALRFANGLKGIEHTTARAYALHQSADRWLRLREFNRARDRFKSAIDLYSLLEPSWIAHNAMPGLVLSYSEAGEYKEAREQICRILTVSQDRQLITSAIQELVGKVLPNLAREGNLGLAELALCLRAVVGKTERPELGVRARDFWRDGHTAWALGAHETALAFYDRARSLFLSLAPDVAGMYEAAIISLDMIDVLLESGSFQEMRDLAREAVTIFSALGADASCLLALGLVQQLETRSAHLAQARIALQYSKKRWLLRSTGKRSKYRSQQGQPKNELCRKGE